MYQPRLIRFFPRSALTCVVLPLLVLGVAREAWALEREGGGTATIAGVDFMKAVWSFWLGKNDQPSLGDALIRNI